MKKTKRPVFLEGAVSNSGLTWNDSWNDWNGYLPTEEEIMKIISKYKDKMEQDLSYIIAEDIAKRIRT